MKKRFTILVLILLNVGMWAQSPPQKMSYQAILRGSNNALITSTMVGMQISILQVDAMGNSAPVYVETQTPTTNINGLVSLEVGTGTVVSGTFSTIDWANGPFYIKIETDPAGGTSYSITGMSQLLSVPYALYAGTSGSGGSGNYWELNGNSNTLDDGTYFIGTTTNIPFNIKVNNQKAGRIDQLLFNTFFGYQSGNANTTGKNNTANGYWSLFNNTTGFNNTAKGFQALYSNTTGFNNAANGVNALYSNTTGSYNTANGLQALYSNTTGSYNTALGNQADVSTGALTNATAIGSGAIVDASNTIQLGNSSVTAVKTTGAITAGTVTYPNAIGASGQVLTVPVSGGNAFWATPASGSGSTHAIGDSYGGGIVFYVYDGGQHGLIASPTMQGQFTWNNGQHRYTGSTGDGLNAGAMNTALIVAMQLNDNPTGNFGAKAVADYSVTDNGITYGDWYLPSKYELELMYLQGSHIPGFINNGGYMSSTEVNNTNYWGLNTSNNTYYSNTKNISALVRAIRAF